MGNPPEYAQMQYAQPGQAPYPPQGYPPQGYPPQAGYAPQPGYPPQAPGVPQGQVHYNNQVIIAQQGNPSENLWGAFLGGCLCGFCFSPILALLVGLCCPTTKSRTVVVGGAGVGGVIASIVYWVWFSMTPQSFSWSFYDYADELWQSYYYENPFWSIVLGIAASTLVVGLLFILIAAVLWKKCVQPENSVASGGVMMKSAPPMQQDGGPIATAPLNQVVVHDTNAPQGYPPQGYQGQPQQQQQQPPAKVLSLESLATTLDIGKLLDASNVDEVLAMEFKELKEKYGLTSEEFMKLKKYKQSIGM